MRKNLYIPCWALLFLVVGTQVNAACPAGTLWEPYDEVCAEVRDARNDFLPAAELSIVVREDAPVPGSMSAGTAYATGHLPALTGGRLHTRMFVYPDGLERDGPLPAWLYTTATSRVDNGLELLAIYSEDQADGLLGLYSWTCLPDYPCPDSSKSPAWQWSRPLPELACNISQVVDQGGHAQKQLYYANHSDRQDDGAPPKWKSAIYLWNFCDEVWDLAWEHSYRQDKENCSIEGATCAWWGPSIEIFGDALYPHIGELGYEDSRLYHDGTWSLLAPPETEFRDPANPSWGSQAPWQLFHLVANRSYGVGNWFNENDAPVIEDQEAIATGIGEPVVLDTSVLVISDPDVDPQYHVSYELSVYGGNNYTYVDGVLTPHDGFTGTLTVPVSVSDGAAQSPTFDLSITVNGIDEPPVIQSQVPLQTLEDLPIVIEMADLVIDYPGGDPAELHLIVHAGDFYAYSGNTVTPSPNFWGVLSVPVTVSDGALESQPYLLVIDVVAVNDPPSITGQLALSTIERMPVEITLGHLVVADPDNEISDLSIRVLDGPGYQFIGNTVSPDPGVVGSLTVSVIVSDGDLTSEPYAFVLQVGADTTPPEISVTGPTTITIALNSLYTDAGATATDNVDGDISNRIVVDNPVITARAGTYTVWYRVEDVAGNLAVATRTVTVQAPEPVSRSSGGGAVSFLLIATLSAAILTRTVAR